MNLYLGNVQCILIGVILLTASPAIGIVAEGMLIPKEQKPPPPPPAGSVPPPSPPSSSGDHIVIFKISAVSYCTVN